MNLRIKVISNGFNAKPSHIISIHVVCVNEMRDYNSVSYLLGQYYNAGIRVNPTKKI